MGAAQLWGQDNEINPLTGLDYPDPDVIRVGDVYYMVTTTMHFMPGCEILRSYDLVNWEHAAYVYDRLDSTPAQRLEHGKNIYGKGMWAASLRFHRDRFYVCFVANDTHKTYLYTSKSIAGPWEKRQMEGFYHDCSLLFDGDDVYIAYGNKDIYITQLNAELTAPLAGGLHRLAVSDAANPRLGYEGAHFYKIHGKYYLFLIHSLRDRWMRTEACFAADSIDGVFAGGDVLIDDRGYCNQGVAQGGIVDTPEGDWYGVLFQDHGAVGRIPVLVPVTWEADVPVFGNNGRLPAQLKLPRNDKKAGHRTWPLVQSDDFKKMTGLSEEQEREQYGCFGLKSVWQFNHEPDLRFVKADREQGVLWITAGKVCQNLLQAGNMLTQRMCYPRCAGDVTVDASALNEGDYAGICALQGCYGMIAVTRRSDGFYVVMRSRPADDDSLQAMPEDGAEGIEWETVPVQKGIVHLKVEAEFAKMQDEARFFYALSCPDAVFHDAACQDQSAWKQIGITHKLYFKMDHFTGCRFGLFVYATKETGGRAGFSGFSYHGIAMKNSGGIRMSETGTRRQAYNPYLPSWEYIPDGEPYVFGDRVYIYGSHDFYNGYVFCMGDYVCWSAPVDNLADWRYEGVIYPKDADPLNKDGKMCLYAPDITIGPDGRYYLYYVLDKVCVVSVAVCDTPAGKYEFYGYVHYSDNTRLGEREGDEPQFDPGVLTQGNQTYLYTGFCPRGDRSRSGAMVTVLGPDMLTVVQAPKIVVPGCEYGTNTGFEGHEYFEAASIRMVGENYYFIYSSVVMHELCYAVSKKPDEGFVYGGVIVSNCDLHIDSYKPADRPMAYGANNHGSIVEIGGAWYIFYHRHTNGTWYSRQGCAEKIELLPDGTIVQAEMTSCGLNGGPLVGKGEYGAYLACNLFTDTPSMYVGDDRFPKIMQDGRDGDENPGYIGNMKDSATAGFKYFDCKNVTAFAIKTRGYAEGCFEVRTKWDGEVLAKIPVHNSNVWEEYRAPLALEDGVHAIYLTYRGSGNASLLSFSML